MAKKLTAAEWIKVLSEAANKKGRSTARKKHPNDKKSKTK